MLARRLARRAAAAYGVWTPFRYRESPSGAIARCGRAQTQRFASTGPTSSRTAAQLEASPGANGANHVLERRGVGPGPAECALVPMVRTPFLAKAGMYAVVQTTRREYDDASPMLAGPSQHGGVG
jgi:hypothetical protein